MTGDISHPRISVMPVSDPPEVTVETEHAPALDPRLKLLPPTKSFIHRSSKGRRTSGTVGLSTFLVKKGPVLEYQTSNRVWFLKMINPHSTFRRTWDVIVVIALLYSIFAIPFRIGFDLMPDQCSGAYLFELIIDILFWMDIVFTFRTYIFVQGTKVKSDFLVAKQYLRFWFWVDFISVFPFNEVFENPRHIPCDSWCGDLYLDMCGVCGGPNITSCDGVDSIAHAPSAGGHQFEYLRLLRLIRMARLFRLSHLSRIANKWSAHFYINRGVSRALKFALTMVLIAHILSCCWFFAAQIFDYNFETWVHRYYWEQHHMSSNPADWANDPENTYNRWNWYAASLYWAITTITTVGYGDIAPVNDFERLFAVIAMMIGAASYGYIVGNMSVLVEHFDPLDKELQDKLEIVNTYLKIRRLDKNLRFDIREFYKHTWGAKQISIRQDLILSELPPRLRCDVMTALMRRIPFFNDLDHDFLVAVSFRLRIEHFVAEKYVFHEGERGDKLFFLISGMVQIVKGFPQGPSTHKAQKVIVTLGPGSYFGEIAMMADIPRTASARTEDTSELYVLDRDGLQFLHEWGYESVYLRIAETASARLSREWTEAELEDLVTLSSRETIGTQWLNQRRDESLEAILDLYEHNSNADGSNPASPGNGGSEASSYSLKTQRRGSMGNTNANTLTNSGFPMSPLAVTSPHAQKVLQAQLSDLSAGQASLADQVHNLGCLMSLVNERLDRLTTGYFAGGAVGDEQSCEAAVSPSQVQVLDPHSFFCTPAVQAPPSNSPPHPNAINRHSITDPHDADDEDEITRAPVKPSGEITRATVKPSGEITRAAANPDTTPVTRRRVFLGGLDDPPIAAPSDTHTNASDPRVAAASTAGSAGHASTTGNTGHPSPTGNTGGAIDDGLRSFVSSLGCAWSRVPGEDGDSGGAAAALPAHHHHHHRPPHDHAANVVSGAHSPAAQSGARATMAAATTTPTPHGGTHSGASGTRSGASAAPTAATATRSGGAGAATTTATRTPHGTGGGVRDAAARVRGVEASHAATPLSPVALAHSAASARQPPHTPVDDAFTPAFL